MFCRNIGASCCASRSPALTVTLPAGSLAATFTPFRSAQGSSRRSDQVVASIRSQASTGSGVPNRSKVLVGEATPAFMAKIIRSSNCTWSSGSGMPTRLWSSVGPTSHSPFQPPAPSARP